MAPALSSNSFLLNTTPSSRLTTLRHPQLAIFAKRAGPFPSFRLGRPADDSSAEESPTDDKASSNSFSFNFGKITDVKALIPVVVANPSTGLSFGNTRRKDPGTVFVAGATGQAGVRIAQTLLREGFTVRAGVADLGAALELARLAAQYKIISAEESKRLNAVQSTFQDAESIAKSIGNASKVVVTVGPFENGPATAVTTTDAAEVVLAAQLAGVDHVAIIYDEAANSSTYNVLDGITSFFGNLFSRSQLLTLPELLQKVVEAGVGYTLIKTRLTEDYSPERGYNVAVSAEGSVGANDYKVAKSQIASLVADVFANTAVAENKVVEVFTDPAAPSKTVDELFSAIPEDGRRKAYAESLAKAEAEEVARKAAERAVEVAEVKKRIQAEVKKLEEQEAQAAGLAEEAQVKAAAAGASVEGLLDKAKVIGSGLSWEKFSSQIATAVQKPTEKPKVQIATVRGQAKAQSLPAKKAVIKQPIPKQKVPPKPNETKAESKPEKRKIFGGLFQQETIYVDD